MISVVEGDPFDTEGCSSRSKRSDWPSRSSAVREAVREAVGDDVELHAGFQDVCFGDFPWQKDGFLPLPEGPGLGVEVDEDWVKANPWRDDAAVWRADTGYIASRQDTNGS